MLCRQGADSRTLTMMGDVVYVAAVEDDPRYRASLETLLGHAVDFELEASYGSADALLQDLDRRDRRPCWSMVLMDLELPGTAGIEATRRLKRLLPDLKVVVLTVFEEAETVLEAICAGADGYLLKRQAGRELLRELRSVSSGGAPLTPGVARTVLKLLQTYVDEEDVGEEADASGPSRLGLTDREQEVLRALARGLSYKLVAAELDIAIDTVRSHARSLYNKLQVHSVAEAVSRAIRERLI